MKWNSKATFKQSHLSVCGVSNYVARASAAMPYVRVEADACVVL